MVKRRGLKSAPIVARDFVGRADELEFLAERMLAAAEGEGSLTLVAGEAGSGKTRLFSELRSRGGSVVPISAFGQCLEFARSPYGPFCSLLQTMLAVFEPAAPPAPHLRTALRSLVPTLNLPVIENTDNEDLQKRWMFEAARETFMRFSAKHPALLVLEDLHWADAGSLDLLRFLAPALVDLRICLVGSYRGENLDRRHPLHVVLGDVSRGQGAFRFDLTPLSDDAALALIDSAVPEPLRLPAETRRQICALGEGNPLFLEELTKHAIELPDAVAAGLPSSLDHAVRARLVALPDDQVPIIEAAAVLGRRFSARELQRLTGAPEAAVQNALRTACNANVMSADPREVDWFQFRHELTRQIIAQQALPALVRGVHRQIASGLEAQRGGAETHAAELTYRWREAGEPEKAAFYAEIAGDQAAANSAFADATAFYESSIGGGKGDADAIARVRRKAGHCHYLIGNLNEAIGHFEAAAEHFEAAHEPGMLARTYIDIAGVCLRRAAMVDAVAASQKAVALARPLYPVDTILLRALLNLSEYAAMSGDPAQAERCLDAADALEGTATAPETVVYHNARAVVAFLHGDLAGWRQAAEFAVRGASAISDPEKYVTTCLNLGSLAGEIGERVLACDYFDRAVEAGDSHSLLSMTSYARLAYADACYEYGRSADARESLYAVLRSGMDSAMVRIGIATAGIPIALALGEDSLLKRCDDPATIEPAAESGESPRFGPLAAAYAQLALANGDTTTAQALLRRALDMMKDVWSNLRTLVLIARISPLDDVERAGALMRTSAEHRPNERARAFGYLFDAYRAGRAGDLHGQRRCALAAVPLFDRTGSQRPLAETYELLAQADAALGLYREMGSLADVARLERAQEKAAKRPILSPREFEIAGHVSDGKSNEEIAAHFTISKRTVEHHMSSIYRKLSIRTRLQLARLWETRASDYRPED